MILGIFIEDVNTLAKIKSQWKFNRKSEVMPCGYGYIMYLVDENNVLIEESINIDCEYITAWIHFPKEYLIDHKHSFKRMTENEEIYFSEKYFKRK